MQYQQLLYEDNRSLKFSYFPQSELLNFVASTQSGVFGTAFVAYSAYDFVNFLKEYSKENIYHIGICDENCIGYNSVLLSPKGVNWAKNFNRIVFLSPVLDEGFISELNEISKAEIYLPMEREFDKQRFSYLDLSRETFGRGFKALIAKNYVKYYSIFDIYLHKMNGKVGFDTFYVAYLVFEQLGLIRTEYDTFMYISQNKNIKKSLTESPLYNKLLLLKNSLETK